MIDLLLLFSSNTLLFLMTYFVLALILLADGLKMKQLKNQFVLWKSVFGMVTSNNKDKIEAPGPKGKFITGNLKIFHGYDIPYKAFSDLAQKYGKIFKLKIGNVPSLVVTGMENIMEVLIHNGHHFNARPNFKRYHVIFQGSKENCKLIKFVKIILIFYFCYMQHLHFATGRMFIKIAVKFLLCTHFLVNFR